MDLYLVCNVNKIEFIKARCLREAKKIFRHKHPKQKIFISQKSIWK